MDSHCAFLPRTTGQLKSIGEWNKPWRVDLIVYSSDLLKSLVLLWYGEAEQEVEYSGSKTIL